MYGKEMEVLNTTTKKMLADQNVSKSVDDQKGERKHSTTLRFGCYDIVTETDDFVLMPNVSFVSYDRPWNDWKNRLEGWRATVGSDVSLVKLAGRAPQSVYMFAGALLTDQYDVSLAFGDISRKQLRRDESCPRSIKSSVEMFDASARITVIYLTFDNNHVFDAKTIAGIPVRNVYSGRLSDDPRFRYELTAQSFQTVVNDVVLFMADALHSANADENCDQIWIATSAHISIAFVMGSQIRRHVLKKPVAILDRVKGFYQVAMEV